MSFTLPDVLETLLHQLGNRANFPHEQGETWSYPQIARIKGRMDVLLSGTHLTVEEVERLFTYESECWSVTAEKQERMEMAIIKRKLNDLLRERPALP